MEVFQHNHYTDVIQMHLKQNTTIRGYQSRLAEVAEVHNSYLSRVMAGQVQLTPDQAARLSNFWKFDPDEANYFLTLVNFARAGSKDLKAILKNQLKDIKGKRADLAARFSEAKVLGEADRGLYYSAWYFSAVHMLLLLPAMNDEKALAERLRLPVELILSALRTLEFLGLATNEGGRWRASMSDVHMSDMSAWAPVYHAAIRQRVAATVHERSPDDMHFTGIQALSRTDFQKIKALLKNAMETLRVTSVKSKEEDVFCVCVDWFKI